MKFKELMDKYKKGISSEKEKKLVEQEIEKYETIEEYLAEKLDMDFMTIRESDNQKEETIKIKKSVNSRLRKVVLTSVAVVLIMVLGIFFIVSPIIDSLYYNPSEVSMGEHLSNIYFDLTAFTELNLPGYAIAGIVGSESLGFGEYNIYFGRHNIFTGETNNISTKIKRDMRIGNYEDFFGENYFNFGFETIRNPDFFESQHVKEKKERVMDHIKKLSPVSYVSVYLTFEKDLTMEEFYDMAMKYSDIKFAWIGIRTAPKNEAVEYITGFSAIPNAGSIAGDRLDEDRYPAFQLVDWLRSNTKPRNQSIWPESYELHYTSLLRYMITRKEAVNALDHNPLKSQYYQSALDYVEEHGVKTFGVLVYANAEDIMGLVENESIKTVELDQVMASRRYIY